MRRNERLWLTVFFAAVITVSALVSRQAFRDGDHSLRVAILVAAAVGLIGAVAHQVVLWRRGELIVRDREQRERNRERNLRVGRPLGWAIAGAVLIAGVYFGDVKALFLALVGAMLLGYTPVLLWVAFVVLPGEQRLDRRTRPDALP
jgi:hypothetical protein